MINLFSLIQMWRYFSHFGVRALLVLFFVDQLHYSDSDAFTVNAAFCALAECTGFFGGIMADRYLGLKRSLLFGCVILGIGYVTLCFEKTLFFALGVIITGTALYSSTITALLGRSFDQNEHQRASGFSRFYVMQNVGALVSTILCAFVAKQFGFHWGFACASLGMILGNLMLFSKCKNIPNDTKKAGVLPLLGILVLLAVGLIGMQFPGIALILLPLITGGIFFNFALRDRTLFFYLTALILFFSVQDQVLSSLLVFSEKGADRILFGWMVPSSLIISLNGIVIILLGALFAKKRTKMATPFLLTGAAFGLVSIVIFAQLNCSILLVMGVVALISVAELMVGPVVISKISESASKGNPGMVMGLIPISYALAYQLSGGLSKMVAMSSSNYGFGFLAISLLMIFAGIGFQFFVKKIASPSKEIGNL